MKTPELAAAFRRAHYELELAQGRVRRRIGKIDRAADEALRGAGCEHHWHYLTPFNPGSITLCMMANEAPLRACAEAIARHGWKNRPAHSESPDGDWQEAGFVIFDADAAAVENLGREHGQLAIVTAELGAAPRLVWL